VAVKWLEITAEQYFLGQGHMLYRGKKSVKSATGRTLKLYRGCVTRLYHEVCEFFTQFFGGWDGLIGGFEQIIAEI